MTGLTTPTIPQQANPIKYATSCRLCGKEVVHMKPFVAVVGDAIDPRLIEYGSELMKHMMVKHQKEFGSIMILTCFNFADPYLVRMLDGLRWAIHQHTRRVWFDEAQIEHKLAEKFTAEEIVKIKPILLDLRDALTEQGAYMPTEAPPNSLIVPGR